MRCYPEISYMTNIKLLTKLGLNYSLQHVIIQNPHISYERGFILNGYEMLC